MITTPDGLLSTLSFVSEHLGDFNHLTLHPCGTTPRKGTIAWNNKKGEIFLFLHWDEKGVSVEIADGVEPDGRGDSNSMYTIIGYCRYQGIAHELVGASLPKLAA